MTDQPDETISDEEYYTLTELIAERQVTARRVHVLDREIERMLASTPPPAA